MTWAIKTNWKYEAVEIVKETAKTATYIDRGWGPARETRADLGKFLDWRGDEEAARSIVEKLTSAKAERQRRESAAYEWFKKRCAEILAAQADRSPEGQDGETRLDRNDESAVRNSECAPKDRS
jgi:hypothetical protein